jgi:hypothetical protein
MLKLMFNKIAKLVDGQLIYQLGQIQKIRNRFLIKVRDQFKIQIIHRMRTFST